MRKMTCGLVVVLLTCGAAFAAQPGVHEMQTIRPDRAFDRAAWEAEQQARFTRLVAGQVEAGLVAPLRVELSAEELAIIEQGRCDGCDRSADRALLAGIVKPAGLTFSLDDVSHGAMRRTAGGMVWTAAISSHDAATLRVHFTDFSLPAGYELWLYSMDGVVRGPYTGRGPGGSGDFWSQSVSGPDAVLQLHGPVRAAARMQPAFSITELGHVGSAAAVKEFCAANAGCVENGECYNVSAVTDAKNAIAHMQYIKRPYIYFCSGGLLANPANPPAPYFLTANHCISRDREAGTLEAFFQFTIPCNSIDCPAYNQIDAPSTLGSTVLATNKSSDFTLLQLHEDPPNGSAFMGWTTAPVVGTSASLYRISHPQGSPQAYSQHDEWEPPVECSSWPRGAWIYSQDKVGATEGGSSGSPVVNAAGQVVGQLSGGCGYNVNDNCDNVNNSTVDGAFAAYYDQVAPWLGGGGPCTDADDDGYCVEDGDCDDGDPFVNPGAAEFCGDGIDNNCDGQIDEGCAGSCLPAGDPCTSGADCCSGLCHPRKLTCK